MFEEKKKGIVIACVISVIVLAVLVYLLLFGSKTYTIQINNGVDIYTQKVKKDAKLSKPVVPEKEGYVFVGWYKDGMLYDFDLKVTSEFVLVAKFEKNGSESKEESEITTTTTTTTPTTTSTTKEENNTTTKKTLTSSNKTTTKTPTTTKAPVATTKPTTTTTTTTTMTTTRAVTYSVVKVDAANSTIGQQIIYVRNNSTGSYVAGTVRVTYVNGNSEVVSVPASGWTVVKSIVASVTDAKGN